MRTAMNQQDTRTMEPARDRSPYEPARLSAPFPPLAAIGHQLAPAEQPECATWWIGNLLARYGEDHRLALACYSLVAHWLGMVECVELLASLERERAQPEREGVLRRAARQQRAALDGLLDDLLRQTRRRCRHALPPAEPDNPARSSASSASLDEIARYALAGPERAGLGPKYFDPDSTPAAPPLTPREREIAALIADGRSNQQIAEELILSVRTVERHIENIYAKLGLSGRAARAAVAAHALCNGLR